jgi:plasmid stability protein
VQTITVKNIPSDLYERLKQVARANHRSINSEIIVCIERALRIQEISPHAVIASARKLREKTAHYTITDEEFTQAKSEGRP